MSEETKQLPAQQTNVNPFAVAESKHINVGAVSIESSRAVAEAQGKLLIAKRFPRNQMEAYQNAMNACKRPSLAEKAIYSYPKGGQTISGPRNRYKERSEETYNDEGYLRKQREHGRQTTSQQNSRGTASGSGGGCRQGVQEDSRRTERSAD